MCAVQAKDGSRHHSASRALLHDELTAVKEPEKKAGTAVAEPGEDKGGTDVSHMDIGEVVSKHGPAHHIVMHHDDDTGTHTVTSHHGEKGKAHMHHSEHGSRKEAHDHAAEAAGANEPTEDDGEPLEEAMETPETEEAEQNRSHGIPGIES